MNVGSHTLECFRTEEWEILVENLVFLADSVARSHHRADVVP